MGHSIAYQDIMTKWKSLLPSSVGPYEDGADDSNILKAGGDVGMTLDSALSSTTVSDASDLGAYVINGIVTSEPDRSFCKSRSNTTSQKRPICSVARPDE